MELIEKLVNSKHNILSYREAKNRRGCDAPGIPKILKQAASLFKLQGLRFGEKVAAYNPKFMVHETAQSNVFTKLEKKNAVLAKARPFTQ